MNYGIKISKPGYDVIDLEKDRGEISANNESTMPHLITAIALPYLQGAKIQIERYLDAAYRLEKSPTSATILCLHEISGLFEDLDTIDRYIKMCGETHSLHNNIRDIRNHIRHDIRDNINNEDHDGRIGRAKKLKIPKQLITSIGFSPTAICVGSIIIEIKSIEDYVSWAEILFNKIIEEATQKGYIKNNAV